MSNLTTYPILSLGTSESLKKANIVVVKRVNWEINKINLPNFLSAYNDNDIKLGKLISSGNTNIYELSNGGVDEFDLILFVINSFELDQPDLTPSLFTSIGVIEIPKIGISNPETTQKLELDFTESSSESGSSINTSVSLNINSANYTDLGEYSLVTEESSKNFYSSILKPTLNYNGSNKLSYVGGGYIFENKLYKKERINLSFSNVSEIISYQQISHNDKEYLRFKFSDGSTILRDITSSPEGELLLSTSNSNVYIEASPNIEFLLNPDYLVYTNLISRVTYIIKTSVIIDGGYTSITEFQTSDKEKVDSRLVWGTDVESNTVSTIFSDPYRTDWCLQSKYNSFFNSLDFLNTSSRSYGLESHNSKIFIIKEFNKNSTNLFRRLAIDYKGNFVELNSSEFNLDIDGNLIIPSGSKFRGFKNNLSSEIKIEKIYDMYSLYPTGTEIIWANQEFSLSSYLSCRDRFQQL